MGGRKNSRFPPFTKNHKQLREAESRRNRLTQERVHQLVIQHQVVRPAIMHSSNIIQKGQVICMNIYVYSYKYILVKVINKKEHEFERDQEGVYGRT